MTKDFPYHKQETVYTCGAACMRMALASLGMRRSEKQIAKLMQTNTVSGTRTKQFPLLAERYKLTHATVRNGRIADLQQYHDAGYVIIINYFYEPDNIGHYAVLRSIGPKQICLWDPWVGPEHKYSLPEFRRLWHGGPKHDKERRWFFAVKKP